MTESEVPEPGETPSSPASQTQAPAQAAPPAKQPRNPLHGLTLEAIVVALHGYYGWEGLAQRVALRCFESDPSVASSLKFLRKTPWAREKVESLYLFMLREQKRQGGGPG
ncbi:VF530 family protein [Acidovorax sp. NCPPB 3576]|uniref:VF530 family protein n=1 Tax=Acidovorax sp. NCPPB 3576 TaxID=2940488 RepID=UPI00234A5D7C|nr:VF530 family protein [Acidovorax sp. NCPPB 3576]WCM89731.1 VF530 family protein [Acidovorax sp. NCPPB 3576]